MDMTNIDKTLDGIIQSVWAIKKLKRFTNNKMIIGHTNVKECILLKGSMIRVSLSVIIKLVESSRMSQAKVFALYSVDVKSG